MTALIARGYTVPTRADVEQITRELRLQRSGLTEQALAEMGKMLNVSAVLAVSVNRVSTERREFLGDRYYLATANISARLISADRAEVMWLGRYTGSVSVSRSSDYEEAVAPVAAVVASGLPAKGRR